MTTPTASLAISAFSLVLLFGCGGTSDSSDETSGGSPSSGGASGSGGGGTSGASGASGSAQGGASGSAQGGASGSAQGGASGSGQGGASGSAQGGASGSTQGGTGGVECAAGCVPLCEGGLCDCYCGASCENFAAPALDKSCASDADCFAGVHVADCCGSQRVLGYSVSEMARFERYEADCKGRAQCLCPQQPPVLEGGQITTDVEQRFAQCSGGQCFGNGPVMVGQ